MAKKKTLPVWLQNQPRMSVKRRVWLLESLGNSQAVYQFMEENKDELVVADYKALLILELERARPRVDVLKRIKGRYNVENSRAEWSELLDWCS